MPANLVKVSKRVLHYDSPLGWQPGQQHQLPHFDSQNGAKNGHNVHNDPVEGKLELHKDRPGGQEVGLGHHPEDQVHVEPGDPAVGAHAYQRHGGEEGDAEQVADEQQQRNDDHGVEEVAGVVGEGPAAGHGESAVFLNR